METAKQSTLHNPHGLKSIYVCHTGTRYGIAVGAAGDQQFQEQPKSVELWKQEGNQLRLVKRFHKRHIVFMEYEDNPFMWVHPRPFVRKSPVA